MRARTTADIEKIRRGVSWVGRLSDGVVGKKDSYFRLGIDPIVGLIPGLGELYTTGTAGYLLLQAYRAHAPTHVLVKMAAYLAADLGIGSIPLFGDVADFFWRGQGMAAKELNRHLDETMFVGRGGVVPPGRRAVFLDD